MLIICSACSKDDNNMPSNDAILNMVTFEGQKDNVCTFSYQGYDDSPLITLNANGYDGSKFKKGERTMLYYYITSQSSTDTKKDINVRYPISTIFDSLRVTNHENIIKYPSNLVQLKSMWRSGEFINMNISLQYTGSPRQFILVMDKSTENNPTVDLYLIDNPLGADGYFYRKAYASFFVGAIWRKSSCNTVRVHVNDENYPDVKYYDFQKQ